jgi:hypothetical protein
VTVQIKTTNVKNLARDIQRAVGREKDKALRSAHRAIANEVRDEARSRGRSSYGKSGSYGRATRAITSRAYPNRARVRLEPKKDPRILGAEYGSHQYKQFRGWTGNQFTAGSGPDAGTGYALHPTLRDKVPEIREEYGDRLMDALAAAFPKRG